MNEIEKSTPRRSHPAWWKYILAVVAFWLLSVFGGIIPMLFNALQPRFARYMPGDLGYEILRVVANCIGSLFGILAFDSIVDNNAPVCGIINCVIAAVLLVVLVLLVFFFGSAPIASYISYLLMIAVYIWGIKRFAKGIRQ